MLISEVFNEDCMLGMKRYPDKFFDLAIVDPEYGIGRDGSLKTTSKHGGRKAYEFRGWDKKPASEKYFKELFRVSKNQVIWGANYFTKNLPPSMGWILWDKGQRICNSDGELAFTSFQRALRIIKLNRVELLLEGTIHPTQKPIKLYKWILNNYANHNCPYKHTKEYNHLCDICKVPLKILDTHLGSQSSRIAAYKLGFDFWGWELDKQYFDEGNERFEKSIAEPLFDKPKELIQSKLL